MVARKGVKPTRVTAYYQTSLLSVERSLHSDRLDVIVCCATDWTNLAVATQAPQQNPERE